MIEIRVTDSFKICIDFTFFAVTALFLSFDTTGYGLMSLAACFIHECGHLTAMIIGGTSISKLSFYGGGIKLSSAVKPTVFVLAAGSCTNFIVFLILYLSSDGTDLFLVLFAVFNLIIGVFNMFPVGYFDGKFLLETVFIRIFEPVVAIKALYIVQAVVYFLIIGLSVFMFFNGFINFTVVIVLIYLFFIDITDKL